jgi:hypothetical protein
MWKWDYTVLYGEQQARQVTWLSVLWDDFHKAFPALTLPRCLN